MMDQATELRKLVLRSLRENAAALGPPPRLIALASGRAGVGTTTLAVNLAVGLAELGARVVIVDADPHRADVAPLCGLSAAGVASAYAATSHDIHEMLRLGPAGVQIVPGWQLGNGPRDSSGMAHERLQRQLRSLGRHAEIVVLDLGSGDRDLLRRFLNSADEVWLVTTPDDAAVMDSYACLKMNQTEGPAIRLQVVVNQATGQPAATDVHQRLEQSCRRFLGSSIGLAGWVPFDPSAARAREASVPLLLFDPGSPAAQAIHRLAGQLSSARTFEDERRRAA